MLHRHSLYWYVQECRPANFRMQFEIGHLMAKFLGCNSSFETYIVLQSIAIFSCYLCSRIPAGYNMTEYYDSTTAIHTRQHFIQYQKQQSYEKLHIRMIRKIECTETTVTSESSRKTVKKACWHERDCGRPILQSERHWKYPRFQPRPILQVRNDSVEKREIVKSEPAFSFHRAVHGNQMVHCKGRGKQSKTAGLLCSSFDEKN